jgi:basic membrane protein A
MKRLWVLILMTLSICVACTRGKESAAPPAAGDAQKPRIGLVLDRGGRDDKSFNAAAFKGASEAAQRFGLEMKDVETPTVSAYESSLRSLAERGYSPVIAVGFAQKDAVTKVAPQFPGTRFAIVDATVDLPNVESLLFAEHEGSFLVGYLAGLATKTGTVGFVGGMEIPMIRRFQMGYEAGVKAARPDTKIESVYIGNTAEAWANPARGKELGLALYGKGADIVFAAAGASGMGVFDAAEEKKRYAIGVDSNQNWIKPGRILTSMLKRVDEAVFDIVKGAVDKRPFAGARVYGLQNKGVDYAADQYNEPLIAAHRAQLEKVRADIIEGRLVVPDFYKIQTASP